MSERPTTPDEIDVLHAWIEHFLSDVHTAKPGRVERYDAATQTADITPLVRHPVPQPDGSFEMESLPIIPSVPVMQFRTGDWFVNVPVKAGDTVLLVFCDTAIGPWRVGDGSVQDPGDLQRHSLSGAVAIPGLFKRSANLAADQGAAGNLGSDLVLGKAGGLRIGLKDSNELSIVQGSATVLKIGADGIVHLATDAGTALAMANLTNQAFQALAGVFSSWTPVPNDGGAALKALLTTLLATWPANVDASKVGGV